MQRKKVKNSIGLFCLILVVLSCKTSGTKKRETGINKKHQRQNIVFITIDDFRPKINSYGESNMITPNIDRLASEGLQFNNAFTNIAVCGASRASIMTGVRPSEKRFNDYSTRASEDFPEAIPLHKIFKENGYETISYGKVFHHLDDFKEYWSEVDSGAQQSDFQDPVSIERQNNAERGEYGKKQVAFEYPDVPNDAYNDGKITRNAILKLESLKKSGKSFFMAVGYVSPHLPFIQPKKYWDFYNHKSIQLAENTYKPDNVPQIAIDAQHNSAELRKNYLDLPKTGNLDAELSRNLIHGYYASVSYMDALIGDLVKSLDDLGLRESTTIVLWSDHGFFLGEHGFWCKHSTFDEAVRIPLIISSSKYSKNKTTDSFAELVDIYPTLCEISNIKAPKFIHGESLVPVLQDPTVQLKTEVYTRYKEGEAVIDKDFSYTEFYKDQEYLGNMLYNLQEDKGQNKDVSSLEEHKELVEKYRNMLLKMRNKVNKKPI